MPFTPLERMSHENSCQEAPDEDAHGEQEGRGHPGAGGLGLQGQFVCPGFGATSIWFSVDLLSLAEAEEEADSSRQVSTLQRAYHCEICQKDLLLTPTEILRHRKLHV